MQVVCCAGTAPGFATGARTDLRFGTFKTGSSASCRGTRPKLRISRLNSLLKMQTVLLTATLQFQRVSKRLRVAADVVL
jgi:hypothetical protein